MVQKTGETSFKAATNKQQKEEQMEETNSKNEIQDISNKEERIEDEENAQKMEQPLDRSAEDLQGLIQNNGIKEDLLMLEDSNDSIEMEIFIKQEVDFPVILDEVGGYEHHYIIQDNAEESPGPGSLVTSASADPVYQCASCEMKFSRPYTLRQHVRAHKNEIFRCWTCDKPFTKNAHAENSTFCEVCMYVSFADQNTLAGHFMITHTGEAPLNTAAAAADLCYKCDECHRSFSTSQGLRCHKRTHQEKPIFECEKCSRAFTKKWHLTGHMRFHSYGKKDKAFTCKICGKSYLLKKSLQFHLRAHARQFLCNVCGKPYNDQSTLHRHMRNHENIFQCDTCSEKFAKKSFLAVHIRRHVREKLFACEVCGKSYASKLHFLSHTRTHTKELFCNLCRKSFTHRSISAKHMKTHLIISSSKSIMTQ